jgi:hypothetical protein
MTNPFAPATPVATAEPAATSPFNVPAAAANPDPASTGNGVSAAPNLGVGDPFASPTGLGGDGSKITDYIGRLLIVKPTEIIESMTTNQGVAHNVVRADVAVLDDPENPGKIVDGMLIFQVALKREAAAILASPVPYLLGRLEKGKIGNGNTLYTFQAPSEPEQALARQFLQAKTL